MVALLLASALLQPAPGPLRIECQPTDPRAFRVSGRAGDSWPLTIMLEVREGNIASVLMDGPSAFSSYRPGTHELRPRIDQWRGRFQNRAIRLRREGWDMIIEPQARSPGSYSGFWTAVAMIEHRRTEANGSLRCSAAAAALIESPRS